MKPYTYAPLAGQHIMLLTLCPGRPDDAIEIFVNHVLFTEDDHPQYEALSYCWGSEDNPRTIAIHPISGLSDQCDMKWRRNQKMTLLLCRRHQIREVEVPAFFRSLELNIPPLLRSMFLPTCILLYCTCD